MSMPIVRTKDLLKALERAGDDNLALRARVAKLEAAKEEAYRYAENFLRSFVSQHFPPNPDWKPLPDLLGVLTQIDNASTIARDYRARNAKLEAALQSIKSYAEDHDDEWVPFTVDEALSNV